MREHLATKIKYISIIAIITVLLTVNYLLIKSESKSKTNGCTEGGCHEFVMRGWFKHAPAKEDCTNCHKYVKGKHPDDNGREFEVSSKVSELCTSCHDITKGDKSKHAPVTQGNCISCHDPHSAQSKQLINTEDGKLNCQKCHKIPNKDAVSVHGPVKKNECTSCHETHNSKFPKLLKKEEKDLCLSCHSKQVKGTNGLIENIKKKVTSKNVHSPVESGCTGCHSPHDSKNKSLLTSDFHTETYIYEKGKTGTLCFTCHSDDILLKDKPESTQFRNWKVNLHSVHVSREKSRNCTICHDVHGSDFPHLINESSKFGKWSLPINFTKNETGGYCTPGCHELMTYTNKSISEIKKGESKPEVTRSENTGYLICQIILKKGIETSKINNLKFHITNIDKSFSKEIELVNNLSFELKDLPKGEYTVAVDKEALLKIKGTSSKMEQKFKITGKSESDKITLKFNLNIHK